MKLKADIQLRSIIIPVTKGFDIVSVHSLNFLRNEAINIAEPTKENNGDKPKQNNHHRRYHRPRKQNGDKKAE